MEFKIDTKSTYTNITPVANCIDANLTEALRQNWNEWKQTSHNFIIDLHNCIKVDDSALKDLLELHEESYANSHSLVFTNLQDDVARLLKSNEAYSLLNITPTIDEAIDIISMEILERELFNEES